MNKIVVAMLLASASMSISTASCAAQQILGWRGNLDYGSTYGTSPFGPVGSNLTGLAYAVTLSYDPTLFANTGSCGAVANTSCQFALSATKFLTETITVGANSATYVWTSGSLNFSAGGSDNFGFSLDGANGSFSGFFQDHDGFYPVQSSVNNPAFASFTDLDLMSATFQQNTSGFSLGDAPTTLTAINPAPIIPEPATWVMMIAGFALIGGALRMAGSGRKVITTGV